MPPSQKHERSILLKETTTEEAFPIILKYFKRKRKIRILESHVPQSIILKIGSLRHYLGWRFLPRLVGMIKIMLISKDEDTRLVIIFDFTKFLRIPSIIPLALVMITFVLAMISRGENLPQNLWILLIFILLFSIPFFVFEYSIKLKHIKETETKIFKDLMNFLKKSFGEERISE